MDIKFNITLKSFNLKGSLKLSELFHCEKLGRFIVDIMGFVMVVQSTVPTVEAITEKLKEYKIVKVIETIKQRRYKLL